VIPRDPALARAYDYCAHMAREHYENFPVASRLLPRSMRPHIAAIYAFARRADDFADEGALEPEHRLRLLDDWGHRLRAAAAGRPSHDAGTEPLAFKDDGLVFDALADTIRACRLPVSLFEDLLSAFRQDVTTTRYATWADVLDYCRRSANPVGRLVLRVSGRDRPELDAVSDAVCTALQLTNFWQDFGRDFRAGRLYVPRDVWAAAGADERDLAAGRMTAPWRQAIGECVEWTDRLFARGRLVCDGVCGRLRAELRATWHGGRLILERVGARRADLLVHRPTLTPADAPLLVWRALRWRAQP